LDIREGAQNAPNGALRDKDWAIFLRNSPLARKKRSAGRAERSASLRRSPDLQHKSKVKEDP